MLTFLKWPLRPLQGTPFSLTSLLTEKNVTVLLTFTVGKQDAEAEDPVDGRQLTVTRSAWGQEICFWSLLVCS